MTQNINRLPLLSAAVSSRLLKRALLAAFPDIKFSVKLSSGTAYGNANVDWADGPTGDDVREVTRGFQGRTFDGRDDSTVHLRTSLEVDGIVYESGLGMILLHRNRYCA